MFLYVKTHPKSKKQKIIWKTENKLEIFCKSKAQQNLANQEIKEILSKELEINIQKIRQISGRQKPQKIFEIKNS